MKTTVEIPDALLARARQAARHDRTTVRQLIEQGLRLVLAERQQPGRFRLRPASFKGDGLQPDAAAAGWDRIRDGIYEGRGA
ncbi:MAG TPA: hypothetical protein VM364_13670 [Vicinamibacterales bacterium]|nr:hypothetical protein [Vicinamibacterales bacterium]